MVCTVFACETIVTPLFKAKSKYTLLLKCDAYKAHTSEGREVREALTLGEVLGIVEEVK